MDQEVRDSISSKEGFPILNGEDSSPDGSPMPPSVLKEPRFSRKNPTITISKNLIYDSPKTDKSPKDVTAYDKERETVFPISNQPSPVHGLRSKEEE